MWVCGRVANPFYLQLTKGYTDLREGSRKPRMSSGPVDAEKSLRGFQHIIQDLNGENADLKQKILDFQVENDALKEVSQPLSPRAHVHL